MAVNMHSYKYEGVDANGKKIKGTTEGTSRSICLKFLENLNMKRFCLSIFLCQMFLSIDITQNVCIFLKKFH